MKKMKKFLKVYMTILMVVAMLCTTLSVSASNNEEKAYERISGKMGTILNAIAWFGYAISLGMFLFIGAKYMVSAANERAQVKQGLVSFVIGAFLIAGASTIAAVVSGLAAGDSSDLAGTIIDKAKSVAGI